MSPCLAPSCRVDIWLSKRHRADTRERWCICVAYGDKQLWPAPSKPGGLAHVAGRRGGPRRRAASRHPAGGIHAVLLMKRLVTLAATRAQARRKREAGAGGAA